MADDTTHPEPMSTGGFFLLKIFFLPTVAKDLGNSGEELLGLSVFFVLSQGL